MWMRAWGGGDVRWVLVSHVLSMLVLMFGGDVHDVGLGLMWMLAWGQK